MLIGSRKPVGFAAEQFLAVAREQAIGDLLDGIDLSWSRRKVAMTLILAMEGTGLGTRARSLSLDNASGLGGFLREWRAAASVFAKLAGRREMLS
jgi:hypothetical protein